MNRSIKPMTVTPVPVIKMGTVERVVYPHFGPTEALVIGFYEEHVVDPKTEHRDCKHDWRDPYMNRQTMFDSRPTTFWVCFDCGAEAYLEKRGSAWRKRIYRYFYGLVEGRNKQ